MPTEPFVTTPTAATAETGVYKQSGRGPSAPASGRIGNTATVAPPDAALWRVCRLAAREQGLAPALAVLGTAPPLGTPGRGGIVLVPAGALPAGATVMREVVLPGGTVVFARVGGGPGAHAGPGPVWLRLGLSQGLLDQCVRYLGERRSGEETLLRKQMVQDSLAKAVTGQLEVEADLVAAGDVLPAGQRTYLHTRVSDVDRRLLRLLGASGYLAGGPGEVADVSELLAGVCEPREGS